MIAFTSVTTITLLPFTGRRTVGRVPAIRLATYRQTGGKVLRTMVLAGLACLIAAPADAEPIILKCKMDDGTIMADLTIDLDKGRFVFGQLPYTIIQNNDEYISAFEKSEVGGEIFAINRVTGEFKRATVGIFYSADDIDDIAADGRKNSRGKFDAFIYTGRCGRKLF